MGRRRKLSPDPFELTTGELDDRGRAQAEHEGRRLAVWGALPGERVQARYLFGRKFRDQAETLEVCHAAPERVEPPCPNFGTCSACTLQHLAESAQLTFKEARLMRELNDVAGLVPVRILPPLVADRWHYRRKARLSVRDVKGKGRVLVGFRERDGRFVTDMESCHTLHPLIADVLAELAPLIESLAARAEIPQLECSCGDEEAALIVRHLQPLCASDLAALEAFEIHSGLRLYLQPKGPDTVHPLSGGESRLNYALPEEGLSFHFGPLDFVQVNQSLNRRMIAQAMGLLEPGPSDRVLDLFCGLGNFTLPLARRADTVLGVEGAGDLVRRGRENAERNGIGNADFVEADLYGEARDGAWLPGDDPFDLVLLDPPRSGAGPVLSRIEATGARRVLYVSCNPRTLAEDAAVLTRDLGFSLNAAGAMDMFPQTTHIEAMALFDRDGGAG